MELVRSVAYPTELWSLLKFKFGGGKEVVMAKINLDSLTPGMRRCNELLNLTSRSFSAVIQALDDDIRPAICIFYLVLRALDTIEDDMSIPTAKKATMLREFHTHLHQKDWRFMESSEKDKAVLEDFCVIACEFQGLKVVFREVIEDITQKMGEGMAIFLDGQVDSMQEWDKYCHYVAGLVGIGLSRLFSSSGLEGEEVGKDRALANSMGLFLQKTNIIRDYLEDVLQGREFWPKEAWSQFGESLGDLQYPQNREDAVHCLNLLITNALHHVPDVISYLSRLHNQSVFNFAAIPQTMAIATLAACYNNPRVFTGAVKIRKGQAVELIMGSTSMQNVCRILAHHTHQIIRKASPEDPNRQNTTTITKKILELCACEESSVCEPSTIRSYVPQLAGMLTIAAIAYVYWNSVY